MYERTEKDMARKGEPCQLQSLDHIIKPDDLVLVTGAPGFIGARLVRVLLDLGFRNLRCLVRPSSDLTRLNGSLEQGDNASNIEVIKANLLSKSDCDAITRDAKVIYHLAAGTGTKSFADAFLNSVVTTRNLLDAALHHGSLRRFVNLSSFAVYNNDNQARPGILDETCPIDSRPELRGDAYCFAKVKQDDLVIEYGRKYSLPYVLVRPGVVYGPGKGRIHGRIGIDTFGLFLHLGGLNPIPFTFVDNCAEAIALAGVVKGIEGEAFNVVDDELPSSRQFLKMFKQQVGHFPSIYMPHAASYLLCLAWEKYSAWSQGQLPPVYNRRQWKASWKKTRYPNEKIKSRLGWSPKVSTTDGLKKYFESCRAQNVYA
jgi:nucleoside-diphosphate-sugar epimerase